MSLLHANDTPGQFPNSWYAASTPLPDPRPPLQGARRADVCVVGGGYTGLSAALHLAEKGYDVVLLEAHRAGFGASGRNGGQLGSGQRMGQDVIEALMGREDARRMWELGEDAKALVRDLVSRHSIDCHLRDGIAHACLSARDLRHEHAHAALLRERYGYDQIESLDRDAFQALCPSPAYVGGTLDMGAAHLHPLAFALGLARAAESAGATLHEGSEVTRITPGARARIETAEGEVSAEHLLLATNGYGSALHPGTAARVMPINNFVAATEPLGTAIPSVLTRDVAVADSKFVVNYFRLSHDGRLLFGGGESYGDRFPADIAAKVRAPMLKIFPQLSGILFDYAWGGTLAITMRRLPYLARLEGNVLSASGYSGHGIGNATQAGRLLAEAVAGDSAGFDVMARIPTRPFPGGARMRLPLLTLAMTWFGLRDRLGI